MEVASPRLASEEVAIAIVAANGSRRKGATTDAIDRDQIFRCMTTPPRSLIEASDSEDHNGFSTV
jgi:hypothetical protein